MDKGAWLATVHGVAENWTQLKQLNMRLCYTLVHIPCRLGY